MAAAAGLRSRLFGTALVGFAVVSLAFFALVAWAAVRAAHFQRQERPFIVAFTRALSQRWQIADVRDQVVPGARPRVTWHSGGSGSVQTGAPALARSRPLGVLQEAHDVRLVHYVFNLHSEHGEMRFTARFQHGQALVSLRLVESGGTTRVLGLELSRVRWTGSA